MQIRRSLAAATLAAAVLLPAAPALAATKANHRTARALTHAIHTTPVAGFDKVPHNRYRVAGPVVTDLSDSWAMGTITARKRFRDSFQGGYFVAVNLAGTHRWVVVDAGSALVGCGTVPDGVLADLLGLPKGNRPCPPGEGVS
jgi:hypothetical protein